MPENKSSPPDEDSIKRFRRLVRSNDDHLDDVSSPESNDEDLPNIQENAPDDRSKGDPGG